LILHLHAAISVLYPVCCSFFFWLQLRPLI
jgi:hypothetical protein